MTRVDGSLARKLDFGANTVPPPGSTRRAPLRLMSAAQGLRSSGRGKYRALDLRRRRAQIAARHLLDLMDARETTR
jgi:hypothetical protein